MLKTGPQKLPLVKRNGRWIEVSPQVAAYNRRKAAVRRKAAAAARTQPRGAQALK